MTGPTQAARPGATLVSGGNGSPGADIRDLADKRLASIEKADRYPAPEGLVGTTHHTKQIPGFRSLRS